MLVLYTMSHPWAIAKSQKQPATHLSPQLRGDRQPSTTDKGPKFLPDDPIWVDPDRLSLPKPRQIELSQIYDFLENTFADPGGGSNRRAQNINTLGEVPDSSRFTNRIGLHPMTVEQLVRGPNRGDGPDRSRPWTIIKAKSEGITPGFVIRDGRGDIYFIKFDPLQYPQMATSTEVISTKFSMPLDITCLKTIWPFCNRINFKSIPKS